MFRTVTYDGSVVAQTPLLTDELTDTLEEAGEDAIAFLPELAAGLLILLLGYVAGRILRPIATRLVGRTQVDRRLEGTTAGDLLGLGRGPAPDRPREQGGQPPQGQGGQPPQGRAEPAPGRPYGPLATAVGLFVKYYVLLLALVLAAERWGLEQLTDWADGLLGYAPEFLAGVAVIVVGIAFADYAARRTRQSDLATERGYGTTLTALVHGGLYLLVFVVGLEMLGLDLRIVYMLVDGVASGVGVGLTVAVALAIGAAAGLVFREYYREEISDDA